MCMCMHACMIFLFISMKITENFDLILVLTAYVVPKFAQLTVTSYFAAYSASHYAISQATRRIEGLHSSQSFHDKSWWSRASSSQITVHAYVAWNKTILIHGSSKFSYITFVICMTFSLIILCGMERVYHFCYVEAGEYTAGKFRKNCYPVLERPSMNTRVR